MTIPEANFFQMCNFHLTKTSWTERGKKKKRTSFFFSYSTKITVDDRKNICTWIDYQHIWSPHVFVYIDAYATAKKLFQQASYPVPAIEISSHNGKDI